MRIGIPKEIKPHEGRVALIPQAAAELVHAGHEVLIQSQAGLASGFDDAQYQALGITVLPDAATLYARAQLIVKVKEPVAQEWPLLRPDHRLFSFLHLAASPELTRALCAIGLTAIGFETVQEQHQRPVLAPMSRIAGRIAIQVGSHYLHRSQGGKGLLLGGMAGTPRGQVVILGGGQAGGEAARLAAALGANVTVFDKQTNVLDRLRNHAANITALYPYSDAIRRAVRHADLLIGAVLIPGAKAPHLVSEEMVKQMPRGSVIVDIAVDQGGCVATTHPTTYENPTYRQHGVIHFGVTNMPGAVPHTASMALSGALLPYVLRLAQTDWRQDTSLRQAINVENGQVVLPALKSS